ncbi:hypothetical protein BDW62DRAFT_29897 [Aspergillus aurantiobrunneus]
MYWPTSKNERWFCSTMVVQAILVLTLEIYNLVQWQSWVHPNATQVPISYSIPITLSLIMFSVVYEVLLCLDMVHHKNSILLLAICISNGCVLIYSVLQYTFMETTTHTIQDNRDFNLEPLVDINRDLWKEIQPAEVLVPIVVGLTTLVMFPVAYSVHSEFSWAIYQCVQGDLKSRYEYLGYEIYLVLNKFDFYYLVGFIIQYNLVDVHFKEPEYSLTMALIPAALLLMSLGAYFVRREYRVATIFIAICRLGVVAYLLSRIIILGGDLHYTTPGRALMFLFAVVALILSILIVLCTIYCTLNFKQGLKSVFARKSQVAQRPFVFQQLPSHPDSIRNSGRSID